MAFYCSAGQERHSILHLLHFVLLYFSFYFLGQSQDGSCFYPVSLSVGVGWECVFCLSISRSICEVCYLPLPFVLFCLICFLPFALLSAFYFFSSRFLTIFFYIFLFHFFFFLFILGLSWRFLFVLSRIFDIFVLLTNLRRSMQTNNPLSARLPLPHTLPPPSQIQLYLQLPICICEMAVGIVGGG